MSEHDRTTPAGSEVLPAGEQRGSEPQQQTGTRVPGRPYGRPERSPNLDTYHFHVVPEYVTGEMLLMIEDGQDKPSVWLHILATFLHESTGEGLEPMDYDKAYARVKQLNMVQMRNTFAKIWEQMRTVMQDTPNPTNGSASSPGPKETDTPQPESR